jgi:anaerobic C4-dicarboxylate transporter DcuB
MVNFPATFLGVIAMCIYSNYRGKELKDDAEFQTRLKDPEFKRQIETSTQTNLGEQLPLSSKISVTIFLLALLVIVTIAVLPEIRTIGNMQSPISMSVIIQIMMLAFGAIILFATKTDVKSIPQSVVFKSGMTACVAIFGIAWMSDTFFKTAMPEFKAAITYIVEDYPWTFALATILVCMSVNSQAATAKIMIPIAVAIGLPGPILIGLMPATYFYFFFPVYPSDVATMNFDITGTTRIGKWYFNHSFMLPGIISMTTACCVGLTMAKLVL